jgi:general secretion pathway protein D
MNRIYIKHIPVSHLCFISMILVICACPPGLSSTTTSVRIPILDKPEMADELISLNFDQTDIRAVLKTVGDITGINFILDDKVQGNVTVMSPTQIRLGDLFAVLETILHVHGFAAVPTGDFVKVVSQSDATQDNVPVHIGFDPTQIPQNDSLITQIMPLKFANVTDVSQIVQPLISTDAKLTTYPRTNSMVVTDTSAKIHHIANLVSMLDVEGSKEQMKVFMLEHASAQRMADQIMKIMQGSSTRPGARRPIGEPIDMSLHILPDPRTNSMIVYAKKQEMDMIDGLVKELDIPRPTGNDTIHVVYLKNAQAKEVAESLMATVANLRLTTGADNTQTIQINADEGTNAVIINAPVQEYEVLKTVIDKLDIIREQVLVEMLIVEVTQNSLAELGVDWATMDAAVNGGIRGFAATNLGVRINQASLEGLSLGAWKSNGSDVSIGAILNALEKKSGANILSTPHIMTSNHQPARILVGEQRAFAMQARITESDPLTPTVIKTYEYKDVGISLDIIPHVSQGGMVRLDITSEFTKLLEDVASISADTPTTAKREAKTVISMQSGSTVVIGGLIRDDKTTVVRKVPIVGNLPLVGALFRHTRDRVEKTNLLLFITPYVMDSQEQLAELTDQKRQQMDEAVEAYQKQPVETR